MNYYELLQVREDASDEVIKMAYKALVKKYHPDTFDGDKSFAEGKMKKINEAFEVLSNVEKRQKYDLFLKQQNANYSQKEENIENKKEPKSEKSKKIVFNKWIVIASIIFMIAIIGWLINFNSKDIENIKDSVVMIKVYDSNEEEIATGSGFCAFESNYIVTNFHVIQGAYSIEIITDDGESYSVFDVEVFNEPADIAILSGNFELEPIKIGNSSNLKAGDKVTVIGSPQGELNTVSTGVISNADNDYQLRTTAPISPGSSGGVLLDSKNKVIGVVYATYNATTAQNLNYAINVDYLLKIYNQLQSEDLTKLTEDNKEFYIEKSNVFEKFEEEKNEYTYIPDIQELICFSIDEIEILGDVTTPTKIFGYMLEKNYPKWYEIYRTLNGENRKLVIEFYESLLENDFDSSNIANQAEDWDRADFFINLGIFEEEEYAVCCIVIANGIENGDVENAVEGQPLEYAEKLLVLDLLCDYDWCYFSDDEQEAIFDYLDEIISDTEDMGAVLELLGYEVEFEDDGTLWAYW